MGLKINTSHCNRRLYLNRSSKISKTADRRWLKTVEFKLNTIPVCRKSCSCYDLYMENGCSNGISDVAQEGAGKC